MNTKKFSDAMSELDNKYVEEAIQYKKRKGKKNIWVKCGALAACLAVVAVLGIGSFQSGLFGSKTDIATLDNGNEIVFVKSEAVGSSIDIDGTITTKQLTEDELTTLFPNLPVTAHAVFRTSDMDASNSPELIGFEGNLGSIKMIASTSEVQLLDTVIDGTKESTEINGINIIAGYSVTDPNSNGEQNTIYYATLGIGSCKIYLENAGTKANSEVTKSQLVEVIQKFLENGELDISSYADNKAGTGLDGNPAGYDPLPHNQTSNEEVSEQDPDAN